jgi:hypothetical protein
LRAGDDAVAVRDVAADQRDRRSANVDAWPAPDTITLSLPSG